MMKGTFSQVMAMLDCCCPLVYYVCNS